MRNKHLAVVLIVLLASTTKASFTLIGAVAPQDTTSEQQLRQKIAEMGTGEKVRVKVTLRDKTSIKGDLAAVNETGVVVRGQKAGQDQAIRYAEIKDLKRDGGFWSGPKWIAIGAGCFGLAVLLVCATTGCSS